ncbi:MAG: hypothetical protein ACLP7Q_05370 [Isosphaeraceae bacterium]
MGRPKFSPREFLKARHPERFSDSERADEPVLDRSLLEYHLHTLTSRGQEKDFEHFARQLAQKVICPNLIPQTGPTGGGDSKVDTETYPVSDHISLTWYAGVGRDAARERWAFAISAKEDWRSKVRPDVEKIAKTERGYTKAFFITNQFVRDKDRAEVEDELSKKHSLDVRILDRSWILDKIFTNRHEALAIEYLKLQTSIRTSSRKGPRDVQREQDLSEVEGRIDRAAQDGRFGLIFVDDCLEAAELARDLERPRAEVEGRFDRAESVAKAYGSTHQQFLCAYARAWTAYWWHEDYPCFIRHHAAAEPLLEGSRNAYELELLTNLWYVLHSLVTRGDVDAAQVGLERKTESLDAALVRLSLEEDRPSTALQARALRLMVCLIRAGAGDTEAIFEELRAVIRESGGLVGFPIEPLADSLIELGKYLGERPGYEKLFETIIEVNSQRNQEVEAARLLLKRGAQRLDADQPAEAIRSLGRALVRLYKHESRHELVRALYLCGAAYERLGLVWAARGTLLNAASVATNEFWSYEDVTLMQAACYHRLKWLELRLGRLPQILAWHEIDRAVRSVLVDRGYHPSEQFDDELNFDAILGILLLRTDVWQLKRLTRLPDLFDRLGLFNASIALRYALGDVGSVEADLTGNGFEAEGLSEYFRLWRDQPAGEQLPPEAQCYDTRSVRLDSQILGCRITVEASNDPGCITLAESILGVLEGLLATGVADRMIAREPTLTITIRAADLADKPFGYSVTDAAGRPAIEIRCPSFDWEANPAEMRAILHDKFLDVMCSILARVFLIGDFEQSLTKLFRDDRALERAINFTVGFAALKNVLGNSPRTSLGAWSDSESREYPLTRGEPWDASCPRTEAEPAPRSVQERPETASEPVRRVVPETGRIAHHEIETTSLIRIALWDRAKWSGTAFVGAEDDSTPPILAPVFGGAEAAGEIFRLLRDDLGGEDEVEKLRVSIIRGISAANPLAYRVVIGVNPNAVLNEAKHRLAVMVSRVNTMEPTSPENLDRFLKSFKACGLYGFAYCTFDSDPRHPRLVTSHVIAKRELYIREAWEIGINDIDCLGILPGDDPMIPETQTEAPVRALLRWLKSKPDSG